MVLIILLTVCLLGPFIALLWFVIASDKEFEKKYKKKD